MLAVHLCAQRVFMAQGAGLNFIKHTSIQLGPAARLTSPGEEPWPGGFAWGARTGQREMLPGSTSAVTAKQGGVKMREIN